MSLPFCSGMIPVQV